MCGFVFVFSVYFSVRKPVFFSVCIFHTHLQIWKLHMQKLVVVVLSGTHFRVCDFWRKSRCSTTDLEIVKMGGGVVLQGSLANNHSLE